MIIIAVYENDELIIPKPDMILKPDTKIFNTCKNKECS